MEALKHEYKLNLFCLGYFRKCSCMLWVIGLNGFQWPFKRKCL